MRMIMTATLLAAATLGGCAGRPGTATRYRPAYIFGGYSEKEIEPGIWRVTGRSNGIAERGFGRDMAVYRAAELMKAKGFHYLQILDQRGKQKSIGIGYGPPTDSAGEYMTLTVRGANEATSPADCRAKQPDLCSTLPIDPLMARLRPGLYIDEPARR